MRKLGMIFALLLLAGCSEEVGRYQPFGSIQSMGYPYVLDTRTGCVLRLTEVVHEEKEIKGFQEITWELNPMNSTQCNP